MTHDAMVWAVVISVGLFLLYTMIKDHEFD
jgi:hypothetical protein